MKTSVIEVRDMLSVLTVDEVEKRFIDMAGVKSATVNFEAKNATVRYDETLLEVADIKVLMHQRGQHSGHESQAKPPSEEKPEPEPTKPNPSPTSSSTPSPGATPNAAPVAAVPVKPVQPLPAKAPESSTSASGVKAPQTPATITDSVAAPAPAPAAAATKVSDPNQTAASATQAKNHDTQSKDPNKEPGTLGKLTAWVQGAFSGTDNAPAQPGATAQAPATTGTKTAPGTTVKGTST